MQSARMLIKCSCCDKEFEIYRYRIRERNYCSKECLAIYRKARSHRGFPIEFKVDENGCFICTSHKPGKRGYPRMHEKLVFRHVYEQMIEPLEEGDLIRHLCDNKLCINPEHLRKGTQLENMKDAIRNGKMPKGSKVGTSIYDELQIYGVKVLIEKTKLTNAEIEHITNVSKDTVYEVRKGNQWKHVEIS